MISIVMILEYILKTLTIFINFVYIYALEISIAVFTIIFALIFNSWFRKRAKNRQKEVKIEEEEDDEIIRQGLQASFKQAKHKLIEKKCISLEDRQKEKERESQTLMQVMKLIQDRQDLFPESSLDDIKQQLNLYRTE